VTSSIDIVKAF